MAKRVVVASLAAALLACSDPSQEIDAAGGWVELTETEAIPLTSHATLWVETREIKFDTHALWLTYACAQCSSEQPVCIPSYGGVAIPRSEVLGKVIAVEQEAVDPPGMEE